MKATDILIQMASLKSVYGHAAKAYANDEAKAKEFLKECYWQIERHPVETEVTFGKDLCKQISEYCQNNP